jgi:hypothetical protein
MFQLLNSLMPLPLSPIQMFYEESFYTKELCKLYALFAWQYYIDIAQWKDFLLWRILK